MSEYNTKDKEDSKKIENLKKRTANDSKKIIALEKKTNIENKKIRFLELKNKKTLKQMKKIQNKLSKISVEKGNNFFNELRKQILTLSVAAFGFLAALTWRDVINAFLAPILKERAGLLEFLLVALFVTCLAIIIPIILTKILNVKSDSKN
ncbi:MAG: DUF5654 family protein [Candidatus ainarchaeum sp.]|nr:DUF5654 family protein [Candidatus ainarchaeum sp.]